MGSLISQYSRNPDQYVFDRQKWEQFEKTGLFLSHLKQIFFEEFIKSEVNNLTQVPEFFPFISGATHIIFKKRAVACN